MKKGKLVTLCIVPLALACLAGCGGSKHDYDNVTVTFWHTMSYDDQIQNIIDAFEKEYPGIHIDAIKVTGSYSDLKSNIETGIPANNYPNMALCYPDHVADYLSTGKVVQMDKYMDDPDIGWTQEERDDMLANLVETGQKLQVEGTYCLPFAASSEALYYNSDALIGLNLSEFDETINDGEAINAAYLNSLTWEELFEHLFPALDAYRETDEGADLINTTTSDYWGYLGYDSDDNLFITLAEQYGYDYTAVSTIDGKGQILFNNDDMKDLMRTFNEAYQKHWIGTQGTCGDTYTDSFFGKQGFLFSVGSTGGVKYQTDSSNGFTTGVAKIPQAKGHSTKQICQGPSICFFDKGDDEQTEAAWLFYKFLTSEPYTTYWATETGYMPVRSSSYTSDDWLDLTSLTNKTGSDYTYAAVLNLYSEISPALFTSPAFKGSATAREQAGSIMTQCLLADDLDDVVNNSTGETRIDYIFRAAENTANLAL